MDLHEILDDEGLDGPSRVALAKAKMEDKRATAQHELAVLRMDRESRAARWRTPLAVALTGLITLGAQFGLDALRSDQQAEIDRRLKELEGEQSVTLEEVRGAVAAELAAQQADTKQALLIREQQFKIMTSELDKIKGAGAQAELDRASALLFLVDIGLLTDLNKEALLDRIRSSAKDAVTKVSLPVTVSVPTLSGAGEARANSDVSVLPPVEPPVFGGSNQNSPVITWELPDFSSQNNPGDGAEPSDGFGVWGQSGTTSPPVVNWAFPDPDAPLKGDAIDLGGFGGVGDDFSRVLSVEEIDSLLRGSTPYLKSSR